MKLGTETGSVINHLYSRMTQGAPAPEVGMGATILGWTDRHAATVVQVTTQGTTPLIAVRECVTRAVKCNAFTEAQEWEHVDDPAYGRLYAYLQQEDGSWREARVDRRTGLFRPVSKKDGGGRGLILGKRDHYRDPSF